MHDVYIGYSPGHTGTHDWHWHMVGMGPNKYFPQNLSLFQLLAPVLRWVYCFNYVCSIMSAGSYSTKKRRKWVLITEKICDIIVTNMWHYFFAKVENMWHYCDKYVTLFFAKVELDLKWFSLLSESLCNSQGKFARRYISLSSAAPVYLYLNENCKHLVWNFCSLSSDMEKVKMLLRKVLWDFPNSPPTLCVLLQVNLYFIGVYAVMGIGLCNLVTTIVVEFNKVLLQRERFPLL